jgi:hypothetical protein
MKYGLFILRKHISSENQNKEYDSVVGDGTLINFLCSLLDYPDNTVKVSIMFINDIFSTKVRGF